MTTAGPTSPTEYDGRQLFSRAQLLTAGFSAYRLRCALLAGQLVAVSPGVYARGGFGAADPVTAHRSAIHALLAGRAGRPDSAGGPVVSHLSAAVLHGLPLPGDVPSTVHVTRVPPAKSRAGVRLTVHSRSLLAGESVEVAGLAVTSMPRTIIDCLLTLPPADGAELLAAALRAGRLGRRDLDDQLRRHPRVPGMRAAAAISVVTGIPVVTGRR